MLYALVSLGVVALAEAGILAYLWMKYRIVAADGAVANAVVSGLSDQLTTVYGDLSQARAALAKRNDSEAKTDGQIIANNPDLDAALGRVNGM